MPAVGLGPEAGFGGLEGCTDPLSEGASVTRLRTRHANDRYPLGRLARPAQPIERSRG